ncbi:MAG: ATP-binding protein, partial [Nitrospiraceae bacterium]
MPLSLYTEKNFVGRNNELDALKRVAHDALSGNATSIFLSGKWGTGKTELLMHLYNHLFRTQKETIPFFYRIKTEVSSLAGFAEDYLTAFLLQSVAFVKKEPSLLYTGIYSLKDLNKMALETGMQWAVDIIESFQQIREGGDSLRSYELAVSAPFRCFLKSEKPFIILIDDFHRLKSLVSADEAKRPWTLFENSLQSRYTPHVISGFQMNIQEMLFEESGIGEHLEVLDLDGLDKESARQLFSALSIRFGISVEPSVINFIDIFRGNPFHIKSFAQAARQKGRTFSRKDLLSVYAKEIMNGKTRSYWTSLLKTHVPEFP